jgi:hypothetical protein
VQVADALLGRRVRCFGCQHPFVATPDRPPPPPARREEPPFREPAIGAEDTPDEDRRPFCPGCGRRIGWEELRCPFCGEELEPEFEGRHRRLRAGDLTRRDYEPHRGSLIASLGNVSMIVGGLSLCMFGTGALISVPVGVLAWLMANRDLEYMRIGRMDPRGKFQTETGRTGGIAGVLLGLIFAAFYAVLYLAK